MYFSYYTVQHHYQLETRSFDLAIFDNIMWNLLRGKWFKASPVLGRVGSHIRYHATFDAYLFAPFYALRQKADTLLVMQSVLSGARGHPALSRHQAQDGERDRRAGSRLRLRDPRSPARA